MRWNDPAFEIVWPAKVEIISRARPNLSGLRAQVTILLKIRPTITARDRSGIYGFAAQLYPICRSITGDGIRRTLGMIAERIPLQFRRCPPEPAIFDWTVPKEWNVRDAYIKDAAGAGWWISSKTACMY